MKIRKSILYHAYRCLQKKEADQTNNWCFHDLQVNVCDKWIYFINHIEVCNEVKQEIFGIYK